MSTARRLSWTFLLMLGAIPEPSGARQVLITWVTAYAAMGVAFWAIAHEHHEQKGTPHAD